jgi:mannose-6-phosphate isomerase-like protein (cupin superfamily)
VLKDLPISHHKALGPALLVKLEALKQALKQDPTLFPSNPDEKSRGRKILVTKLYPLTEKEAAEVEWQPPKQLEKCPVQLMRDTEMAVFTDRTSQDRHYHKKGTEVYTVLNGEMTIEIDQQDFSLSTGDAIVVNPGTPHQVKPGDKEFVCQVICINCSGETDKYVQ